MNQGIEMLRDLHHSINVTKPKWRQICIRSISDIVEEVYSDPCTFCCNVHVYSFNTLIMTMTRWHPTAMNDYT